MKNRMIQWGAILVLAALFYGAAGLSVQGPEQLGAHWARLSDRAQLECLVDGLRRATAGSPAQRIMMRNAGVGKSLQIVASSKAQGDASTVTIRADGAAIDFGGSGLAQFNRTSSGWQAVSGVIPHAIAPSISASPMGEAGAFSVGATFIETPVSKDFGIDRLSRSVTLSKIGRALFRTPGPTASYYTAHYMQTAPYVTATYIQFVVDAAWNRVMYGNMNAWIRSYDDLIAPNSIAVDASGRVFISESGRERVTVLQIEGAGQGAQLVPAFTLGPVIAPTAVAHSDNGTPLDPADDFLYVADAAKGTILKYSLGPTGGTLAASFDGFDSPSALAVGRWNGVNNGFVYVVDHVAKRLRVLEDTGNSLSPVAEYDGGHDAYFSSLAVDHFGNVYVADNTSSRLLKFTGALELLDQESGPGIYDALAAVDVPFGLITIDGQGTSWAGFDQLFAVEHWSDAAGAQRRTLGLSLKNIQFTADDDVSSVDGRFILTDFGTVVARIADASGNTVRTLAASAMVSGLKDLVWDRRDDSGRLVGPGQYSYSLSATDPYRSETISANAQWTLPLYYEERGGIDEPHLIRGLPLHWGSYSASQDGEAVQYRFTGLTPASSYQVSAEFIAPPDGAPRVQDLTAGNGIRLHDPVSVTQTVTKTGFVNVPAAAFASGELVVSVNRRDAGSAVISRLLLKENGRGFTSTPQGQAVPTKYALEQNYPNPFNPSTVIRYDLPQSGQVSLIVYDVTGREVAQLVNGVEAAGSYEVRFDAGSVRHGGLASGVYFYRVRAGAYTETRKMMLIK